MQEHYIDVSKLLLKSLGLDPFLLLLLRICSRDAFFLINNSPLKRQVSNYPSFQINNFLQPLLWSLNLISPSFKYGGENLLDIWKDLDWYCWIVFLWEIWSWFGPFYWWQIFPNFLLKIGSIMVEWCAVVVYTSTVSKF